MYKVDISNNGSSVFEVKSKDYTFLVDTKGGGITPPDTLLAGLGTCVGVYIRKYMDSAKIKLDKFNVNVEADFSYEPPISFRQINVLIDLGGLKLEPAREKALLDFVKNCPVHNTLKNNPAVGIMLK